MNVIILNNTSLMIVLPISYYFCRANVQGFMRSDFRKEEVNQTWTVKDADIVIAKAAQDVLSPPFSILGLKKKFVIHITHITRYNTYTCNGLLNKTYLQISIREEGQLMFFHKPTSISYDYDLNVWIMQYSCDILNPHNEVISSYSMAASTFFIKKGITESVSAQFDDTEEVFKSYLYNGAFTVQVKGTFMLLNNPIASVWKEVIPQETSINKKLKLMYDEQLFTDVQIKVGGKTFKAHRGVLASHSSVFRRMFEVNMRERRERVVEISDVQPAVMSELLAFFYTGSAPNMKTLAKYLLLAADKYNVPDLVSQCDRELKTNLTPSNAAEVLLLASTLQLDSSQSLKKSCLNYIKHNSALVYKSDSWKKLKATSLELAVEVMEATAQ